MAAKKGGRKAAEELVLAVMKKLDASGANRSKYEKFFRGMKDAEFASWAKKFCADPNANFYLEVRPFETEPSLADVRAAADILGIPLEERLYYRHDGNKDDPVATPVDVPVGYLIVKRLQQMLAKKNTYSLDISKRDMLLNQVSGDDKIARVSDSENYALSAMGMDKCLEELLGPRADNRAKKRQLYQALHADGMARLADLKSQPEDSQALAAADVFFLSAGLKTNLLTPGMALPRTLKRLNKDDR